MPAATWIIAFGFTSPWMLWGVGLAGVPLVIHLLYRRRYRETAWAAMQFLTAALRKQSRRMWLEQWLLLAVRTAILLLIALALAGPTLENLAAFHLPPAQPPTHRILVIDASLSMSYLKGEQSRFELARDVGRKLLHASRENDVWNLVRISGPSPAVIIRRPTPQIDAVALELDQMTPLEEVGNLARALKETADLLRSTAEPTRKEVFILTDLQTTAWTPGDPTERARIRQQLQDLGRLATVSIAMVGSVSEVPNSAVSRLEPAEGWHRTSPSLPLRIGLRQFGGVKTAEAVEFTVDGLRHDSQTEQLVPGTESLADHPVKLSVGEHRLEARLKSDGLIADDCRRAIVSVAGRLPILLVNGKPSGQPWENSTDLLKLALAPDESSPFAPVVIPESELLSTRLADYSCVFLCNLALITDREARWLSDYLAQGGAVVFCLGSQVRLDQYNQTLLTSERSLLPARLVEVVGDPHSTTDAVEFDPGDFNHPIVKPFQGNPNSGLELTRTFAYVKTELPRDRDTQVALRFQTGDAAILTASAGRGRVVLITTSVDREWSTWAVWGHSFIPLVHEIVQYAVANRLQDRQLLVGEPISALAPDESVRSAELLLPEEKSVTLDVIDRRLTFDQTLRSGFYELRWGAPLNRSDWYAVNVDLAESDLAALDETALNQAYLETVGWNFFSSGVLPTMTSASDSDLEAVLTTGSSTSTWSRQLLILSFWLLLVEQGLAWKFPAGLTVLGIGAALFVIQWLMTRSAAPWEAALVWSGPVIAVVLIGLWQRRRMRLR